MARRAARKPPSTAPGDDRGRRRGVRGLIAYDTYYGNGAQVAEAIADELRAAGHRAPPGEPAPGEDPCARRGRRDRLPSARGPTRISTIGGRRAFARKLDAKVWAGKPALVYDTYGPLDPDPVKNEGNPWMFPGGVAELENDARPSAASPWHRTSCAASSAR